jgi:type VI protein secretion system component VasF
MGDIGKGTGLRRREERSGADAYFWPERRGSPIRPNKKGGRHRRERSLGEMLLWLLVIVIVLLVIDAYYLNGQYLHHIEAEINATSESWRAASNGIWGAK